MWHKRAEELLFSSLTMDQFTDLASQNVHTTKLLILNSPWNAKCYTLIFQYSIPRLYLSYVDFFQPCIKGYIYTQEVVFWSSSTDKKAIRLTCLYHRAVETAEVETSVSVHGCSKQGSMDFPKVKAPSPIFWFRKSDIKEVLYRRSAIQVWPVNRTVVWRFSARCF